MRVRAPIRVPRAYASIWPEGGYVALAAEAADLRELFLRASAQLPPLKSASSSIPPPSAPSDACTPCTPWAPRAAWVPAASSGDCAGDTCGGRSAVGINSSSSASASVSSSATTSGGGRLAGAGGVFSWGALWDFLGWGWGWDGCSSFSRCPCRGSSVASGAGGARSGLAKSCMIPWSWGNVPPTSLAGGTLGAFLPLLLPLVGGGAGALFPFHCRAAEAAQAAAHTKLAPSLAIGDTTSRKDRGAVGDWASLCAGLSGSLFVMPNCAYTKSISPDPL
mmetsp:Transcript_2846/g.6578  ORF Transcript_2846/g.6578 Transcript_2846/m.6578 type:complete len:278 (+) Transcript_2846:880-1713(+)